MVPQKKVLKDHGKAKALVVHYDDSNGQRKWKGTGDLRGSECYPPQFGLKFVEIFHSLISDKLGMPELPLTVPSAEETFASLEFSDVWSEASMVSLCHYLRSGIHLKIPPSFRELLPAKL